MDFGSLLQAAKKNEHSKKEVRYYSTKFSPPKKEEKKVSKLSVNVQKFLARKEAEEKQKMKEANRKRDELLALRSKDKKAQRRVNVMLKRTKSANQSVIEDAVDNDNTAVTLVGPSQPDEDDYGYVSQEAADYYNKMMEKYSKMPDEPKFPTNKKKASSNLLSTKDRVKAALEREREEALLPHKRKRKHRDEGSDVKEDSRGGYEEEGKEERSETPTPAKVKPKVNAPPPMKFTDILRLAEKKQFEPIVVEVKPKDDEGPLMTKKQKREYEQMQQMKESKRIRDLARLNPEKSESRIPKVASAQTNGQRMKSGCDDVSPKPSIVNRSNFNKTNSNTPKSSSLNNIRDTQQRNSSQSQNNFSKPEISSNKLKLPPSKRSEFNAISNNKKPQAKEIDRKTTTLKSTTNNKPVQRINGIISNPKRDISLNGSRDLQKSGNLPIREKEISKNVQQIRKPPNDLKPKQFPPKDLKPKKFPPADLKPKQFPPADLKPKQFPPPDVRRKEFPPKDVRRKPPITNKRRILDDDDDYDSEMDDFIDDGPEEGEDYSSYIKDIFGYDKSRYRDADEDDVDNMESTFAQQMREDVRSTKLGIMEDLEDMQREKEEKLMKAMKKRRKVK